MSGLPSGASLRLGVLAIMAAGCAPQSKPEQVAPERPSERAAAQASTVHADDIERAPGESIEKVLEGRIAGVVVSRNPDGSIAVRIRGASSFYGNNEPLYVLDGMPIQPGPGGALTGISPYDIQSIRVLKDPAETAMYGVRGANGVVLIKTKKPEKTTTKP